MELSWAIDDVARTSDEEAVRRRFDLRNLRWLLVLLLFFGLMSVILLGSNSARRTSFDLILAFTSLILILAGLLLVRDALRGGSDKPGFWRAGHWIRDHVTATILAYLPLQHALLLIFSRRGDDWVGWAATIPLFLIPLRMRVPELLLLHGLLYASVIIMVFFGSGVSILGGLVGAAVTNGIALSTELFLSRRMRREVIGDWSGRRSQALEQIRMRDELQYARELQLSMLPECAPRLEWIDICSICIPATEVGGDYYDYFVEKDRVVLVCGDVAGHGMASGLVLAGLRSGFTLLRDSLHDPAAVLRRLHDLVTQTTRRRMLVTVSVLLIDRVRRIATIASAGHPPVIRRRGDGTTDVINLWAPPLGVRLPVDIPQRHLDLEPGDLFVLHSDGVYECRNVDGDVYGLDRLEQVIREQGTGSAERVRDAVLSDITAFRGAAEQEDDVTIVVCRVA
ncbi:MAG TPA: PP2C family protein-serine/threonine phosphatase [Thermoanaerobaculia bacterium]